MQQVNGMEESKETELLNRLRKTLEQQSLDLSQQMVLRLSKELDISVLECAAALLSLNQPQHAADRSNKPAVVSRNTPAKSVRYRINVGRVHQVTLVEIKDVLVDVSGVENHRIGRVEIRNHYTLVDLPEGMPADIFQLLTETEIRQQQLNLKRVKNYRRFMRRNKNIK